MRGKTIALLSATITAVLTSAFWILAYNAALAPDPSSTENDVDLAGDAATVRSNGAPPVTIAEGVVVGPGGLAVPVAGVRVDQLVDTYTQARTGESGLHDAIDIMAPNGTPVVAATPGVVEKLFFSQGGGGITAYVRSPDRRWIYYYAHLQEYAPGLGEGQTVRRGQLLGRVGHSGNASPGGPHLHFAIHRTTPEEQWWQGTAINPYPLIASNRPSANG